MEPVHAIYSLIGKSWVVDNQFSKEEVGSLWIFIICLTQDVSKCEKYGEMKEKITFFPSK